MLPLVQRLERVPDVTHALRAFSTLPRVCLLESAKVLPELGRYSFLMADPFAVSACNAIDADPFAEAESLLQKYTAKTIEGLPPFQGGAAGVLSYELGGCFEKIPVAKHNDFPIPLLSLGFYDVVLVWDHISEEAWLISHGWPETTEDARVKRAAERLRNFQTLLETEASKPVASTPVSSTTATKTTNFDNHFPTPWSGNFSSAGYRQAIQKAIEYIYAGDIFQVNLSQRWIHPAVCSSLELYLELRAVNPAPFAAYIEMDGTEILSASPERFLRMRDRHIETRPIKGTRLRSPHPLVDLWVGDSLTESRKDRAENLMIVDLLRNDLSRVCDIESVRVTQLCGVERYQYVVHLVSAVEGILANDVPAFDLLRATFPGGSITGAPKVRAMEIIAELEPTTRGAYCGCIGYVGFDGTMDWNIAIRTITAQEGWWQVQAGGGIVADSDPSSEEAETWHKAQGLVRAIDLVNHRHRHA